MPVKKIELMNIETPMVPNSSDLTVSLVQMHSSSSLKSNFNNAVGYLHQAISEHHAQLIVFPENFLTLGLSDLNAKQEELTSCIQAFKHFAKLNNVFLLLGSIPISYSEHKFYSRSFLISSAGEIIGSYDKIHLFDVFVADNQGAYKESDTYVAGSSAEVFPVFDYKLGLSICYDLRFPELYQSLRRQGADLIAAPSAFTFKTGQAHWELLVRTRAIETQCFMLAANHCGEHVNVSTNTARVTWGHSMIVDPWGRVLSSLGHEPGICSAKCNMLSLKEVRDGMNLFSHKRP